MLLGNCSVPKVDELPKSKKSLYECDGENPCSKGFECFLGRCLSPKMEDCDTADVYVTCGTDVGACMKGRIYCDDQKRLDGGCVGSVGPVEETCNGVDDDCDGIPDEKEDLFDRRRPCELSKGVCGGALRRCVGKDFESKCTAASYGSDYEPIEMRCDGLDNDCDKWIDEDVKAPCENQLGVCRGSTQQCQQGTFPGCSSSDYKSWEPTAYEDGLEITCDGTDNNCDGFVDSWNAVRVSTGPSSRNVAAAAFPDAGLLYNGYLTSDVAVLWEENGKVWVRIVSRDGQLSSAPVFPARSVETSRAWAPAATANAQDVFAAWAEEPPLDAGFRVMFAPLDRNREGGSAHLENGDPSAYPAFRGGDILNPVRIALAAGSSKVVIVVLDEVDSTPSYAIKMVAYDVNDLTTVLWGPITLATGSLASPQVAVTESRQAVCVAWENPLEQKVVARLLQTTDGGSACAAGNCSYLSFPGASEPQVIPGALVYANRDGGVPYCTVVFHDEPGQQVTSADCSNTACTPAPMFKNDTGKAMHQFSLVGDPIFGPVLAVWTEDATPRSPSVVRAWVRQPPPNPPLVFPLNEGFMTALRPVPLITTSNLLQGKRGMVLFETTGETRDAPGDEVFARHICLGHR